MDITELPVSDGNDSKTQRDVDCEFDLSRFPQGFPPRWLDRRRIAKQAIREKWGLREMRQRIRREVGPQRTGVRSGRKRHVKWNDKVEILDEIDRLCLGWIRFADDLRNNSGESGAKLYVSVEETFSEITDQMVRLQKKLSRQLSRNRQN